MATAVEWQLHELDNGELHRCPAKDGARRTIDIPSWLSTMLSDHIVAKRLAPSPCHGFVYTFRGLAPANGASGQPGPRLIDVARRVGVSTGTVCAVLNQAPSVAESTRTNVEAAIAELGYARLVRRRGGPLAAQRIRDLLFQSAATGWYPRKAPSLPRPVPVLAQPWPGVPARGRGAPARADCCWLPVVRGLTSHGLRPTHRTLMDELGVPPKLTDERMGHQDGSVRARYSHVTARDAEAVDGRSDGVVGRGCGGQAADEPGLAGVAVLDRVLRPTHKIVSQSSPQEIH
jgi:hypothetical protein